jgi:crossover junction endodeoxyribonuclease RuvC
VTRYVGIDPSTKTGLVIIENKQVVFAKEITSKSKEDPHRFIDIATQIREHITESDIICIEGFSYGSKGKGVSTQYGIGWEIRSELIRHGFSFYDVAPSSVKKFATGKGNTKKDEMVLPIYKKWGFESNSDNIRDAFVLAMFGKGLRDSAKLTDYQKDSLKKMKKVSP